MFLIKTLLLLLLIGMTWIAVGNLLITKLDSILNDIETTHNIPRETINKIIVILAPVMLVIVIFGEIVTIFNKNK